MSDVCIVIIMFNLVIDMIIGLECFECGCVNIGCSVM